MSVSVGDLVEAVSKLNGKVLKGIVTGIIDDDTVCVEMSGFATLCKNPCQIALANFDSTGKWWIERKRKELRERQEYKEAHPNEVTHHE